MNAFSFEQVDSVHEALELGEVTHSKYLGGGTNLVDLMRSNLEAPQRVVDVTKIPGAIQELPNGNLLIGASVKNTTMASDLRIRTTWPLVARAILAGASGQVRNMATLGGNILQRTRCAYFYDGEGSHCNKRTPGQGCDAIQGLHRNHAILGTSQSCIATHPSDLCIALVALDAIVHLESSEGRRKMALTDLHRFPESRPDLETHLLPGELITHVELPFMSWAANAQYRKVRDRSSYAFALVSIGAALELKENRIQNVRVAFGGVGVKPWRAHRAEKVLLNQIFSKSLLEAAADAEFSMAKTLQDNDFKVGLAKRLTVSTLTELAGKKS